MDRGRGGPIVRENGGVAKRTDPRTLCVMSMPPLMRILKSATLFDIDLTDALESAEREGCPREVVFMAADGFARRMWEARNEARFVKRAVPPLDLRAMLASAASAPNPDRLVHELGMARYYARALAEWSDNPSDAIARFLRGEIVNLSRSGPDADRAELARMHEDVSTLFGQEAADEAMPILECLMKGARAAEAIDGSDADRRNAMYQEMGKVLGEDDATHLKVAAEDAFEKMEAASAKMGGELSDADGARISNDLVRRLMRRPHAPPIRMRVALRRTIVARVRRSSRAHRGHRKAVRLSAVASAGDGPSPPEGPLSARASRRQEASTSSAPAARSSVDAPSEESADAPTTALITNADNDVRDEPCDRARGSSSTSPPPAIEGGTSRAQAATRNASLFNHVAMPANTKRVYKSRFALFAAWCEARGIAPVPASPEVIQEYLVSLASETSLATINVTRAAIVKAHVVLGHAPPSSEQLDSTLRVLRKEGRNEHREGISPTVLETIVAACDNDALANRDRALLLAMRSGDLRRAEVVGLDLEGCHRDKEGYRLRVVRRGQRSAFVLLRAGPDPRLCPVAALDAWLAQREELVGASGPLFVALHPGRRHHKAVVGQRLSPEDVGRIFKRRASVAGLDRLAFSTEDVRVSRATLSTNVACGRVAPVERAYERGCPTNLR